MIMGNIGMCAYLFCLPEVWPEEGLHDPDIGGPFLGTDGFQGPPVVHSVNGSQDGRGHEEKVAGVDSQPPVLGLRIGEVAAI